MNSKKYIINIFVLGFLLSFVQFSYATWIVPEDSDVSGVLKITRGNNQNTVELFRCTEVHGDCEFIMTQPYKGFSMLEMRYSNEFEQTIVVLIIAGVVLLIGVPVAFYGTKGTVVLYSSVIGVSTLATILFDAYKDLNVLRLWDYKQVYNVDLLMDDQAVIFLSYNLDEIIEELENNKLNESIPNKKRKISPYYPILKIPG